MFFCFWVKLAKKGCKFCTSLNFARKNWCHSPIDGANLIAGLIKILSAEAPIGSFFRHSVCVCGERSRLAPLGRDPTSISRIEKTQPVFIWNVKCSSIVVHYLCAISGQKLRAPTRAGPFILYPQGSVEFDAYIRLLIGQPLRRHVHVAGRDHFWPTTILTANETQSRTSWGPPGDL